MHLLCFISSNYFTRNEIHSHYQNIFYLITTFVQLCSNDVCQLNIFLFITFEYFYSFLIFFIYCIFFSHENV